MKLLLGKDFPASPPKGYFLTKIFHPNVGANGEICVNVLKRDWTAELGIRHVLLVSPGLQLFGKSEALALSGGPGTLRSLCRWFSARGTPAGNGGEGRDVTVLRAQLAGC